MVLSQLKLNENIGILQKLDLQLEKTFFSVCSKNW